MTTQIAINTRGLTCPTCGRADLRVDTASDDILYCPDHAGQPIPRFGPEIARAEQALSLSGLGYETIRDLTDQLDRAREYLEEHGAGILVSLAARAEREHLDSVRGDEPRKGTAAHARWTGQGLGLVGEAHNLFVKGGAPARHARRTEEARGALCALAETIDPNHATEVAILLGLLDGIGVGGGAGGLRGRGTTRIPGLGELGKGRKAATDGGAYSSAIRSVVHELIGDEQTRIAIYPCPTDAHQLRVATRDGGEVQVIRRYTSDDEDAPAQFAHHDPAAPIGQSPTDHIVDVTLPAEFRPWLRQLAERALLTLGAGTQAFSQPDEGVRGAAFAFRLEDAGAWAWLLGDSAEPETSSNAERW